MKKEDFMKKIGQQLEIPILHSDKHVTTPEGVEMGVLENGMPYLSQRGLINMTGVPRTTFQRISDEWIDRKTKKDGIALGINKLLEQNKYFEDKLYIEVEQGGKKIYAYTEPVCLAVLEYYAFDAKNVIEKAQISYRSLSKAGFRLFVYEYTGYSPESRQIDSWKHFHDRVDMTLDSVPIGYFSVFREIASMIVPMIRAGVMISDKAVPDISVGKAWSDYWKSKNLVDIYGERIRYEHDYPLYYPQSKSNPQPAFAYPDSCLGVFREWLRLNYIVNKFPKYILGQSKKGNITQLTASKAIGSFKELQIENNKNSNFDKSLKKALDYNPKS